MSISDWSSDVCSSDLAGWQNEAAAQTLQDFMKSTQQDGRALFGSTEISAKKLTALPQWARVLGKMRTERKQFRACLDNEAACTAAGLRSWREVARATRGKPEIEVLKTVTGYFNRSEGRRVGQEGVRT